MAKEIIEIEAANSFQLSKKVKTIQIISNLSEIEIERLGKIAESPKAKNYLNTKWLIVRSFFGIK